MKYVEWVNDIMKHYSFHDPHADFIRHNENVTFRVIDKSTNDSYLLRIHLPVTDNMGGLQHTPGGVQAELDILSALSKSQDILFQTPVPNRNGELVTTYALEQQTVYCSVLHWVKGEQVKGEMLTTTETVSALGNRIAELHRLTKNYLPGTPFVRPEYGNGWAMGMLQKLKPCEELGIISTNDVRIIEDTFALINERLKVSLETWGLIHADINYGNLIQTDRGISFIDFGLSGYGHFAMDVAMGALLIQKNLRDDFLNGYNKILPGTDVKLLGMFMLLPIFGYYTFQVSNKDQHQWIKEKAPFLCKRCTDFINDKVIFYDF